MKHYCFLLSFTLTAMLFACKNTSNNNSNLRSSQNSKKVDIQLVDSLGTITLFVPLRYDTSFSWLCESDCGKPCAEQKYRFQPQRFPIIKETGLYFKESSQDSIDRFTISHSGLIRLQDGGMNIDSIRHNHFKEKEKLDPTNPPIVFDTLQKVNDRYYSIIVMEKSDTIYSKQVLAITTIKSNLVKFKYELLTRRNDSIAKNFIKNSIDLLKTIHISKGI